MEAPKWAVEILHHAGGVNIFGEDCYRLVWGYNRLSWKGGLWEDREYPSMRLLREQFDLRWVPKYIKRDRWHLEVWNPPANYGTPEVWNEQTRIYDPRYGATSSLLALGPYPSRGEYESIWVIENQRGGFKQITRPVVEFVAGIVTAHRQATKEYRWARFRKWQEEQEKQREREMDSVLDDALDIPFGGLSSNTSPKGWTDIIAEERERYQN